MKLNSAWLAGIGCWVAVTGVVLTGTGPQKTPPNKPAAKTTAKKAATADPGVPLSPASREDFWYQYDLGPLLQLQPNRGAGQAQSGFFGKEGLRIDVALLQIRRDANQPQLYHVWGKTRCFKNVVVPFAGTILLKQVVRVPAETSNSPAEPSYCITGQFTFKEKSQDADNTGTFRGNVAIGMAVSPNGLHHLARLVTGQTGGNSFKFNGQWVSAATGEADRVVWAESWRSLGRQLFSDFEIGERMPSINGKYTRLGWSRYWQNEEWWADSPGSNARLSL